jgi:hydrogenase-4 component F
VREHFGTLRMERIRGMALALPWTSGGLIVGGLAIVGMPPFGLFVSEFIILTAAFTQANYAVAVIVLVGLSIVFGALLHHVQPMLSAGDGESSHTAAPAEMTMEQPRQRSRLLVTAFVPMAICAVALLVLGVRIPLSFVDLLHQAMAVLQS